VTNEQSSMRTPYTACPLCSSPRIAPLREYDCRGHALYDNRLPPTIRWVACAECAHVFVDGYFTDEALAILFQRVQASQFPAWSYDHNQRLIHARMVASVAQHRPQLGGRWLDVGFGNGLLMTTAEEYGFDVTGIDLRAQSVRAMVELGFRAECVDLAVFDAPPFDVISMADVLEHMPFPKVGLAAAHRLLVAGGLLFLSMPNTECFAWRSNDHFGTNPYWVELEHFHNFGRKRLYALLEEHGFEPCAYGVNERYFLGMEVIAAKR
jgi:SAM-dependent methyltransferase